MIRDLKQSHSVKVGDADKLPKYRARRLLLLGLLTCGAITLCLRAVDLHILDKDFLQNQANIRHVRTIEAPAHRGVILDRHGEPLAISIPVDSVWVNPKQIGRDNDAIVRLAQAIGIDAAQLRRKIQRRRQKSFLYIRRHAHPLLVEKVKALNLPSVHTLREYRRFYPNAEASAQVVGFTNVDDIGQEGVELAFNRALSGEKGVKRVILDGKRNAVENIESLKTMHPGASITLSIDRQLQYLTYRALKKAVRQHRAKSASAVILQVDTGEILAMTNYPSFNPNNRNVKERGYFRNRVVTDVFEPGSTIKPFTVAYALMSGQYQPDTLIDTTPGSYRVGRLLVRDFRNYGRIDVTQAITVSSNVAVTKMALSTAAKPYWSLLRALGFGQSTASGFPGEVIGALRHYAKWRPVDRATLAYGYGISVTSLQLAAAYMVLADNGRSKPVSLLKVTQKPASVVVMPEQIARNLRQMMKTVVAKKGTGRLAAVAGYTIAGKTGTVKKSIAGGYAKHQYVSVFSGMAPALAPKLVMVVMVDDPSGKEYYGGKVAAPVFAEVMKSALRILGVAPDALPVVNSHIAQGGTL